jgi:hypothetical protein
VRTVFDNSPAIEHQDTVTVRNGGQSVCAFSVTESRLEVASSRIRIGAFFNTTRAMATRWPGAIRTDRSSNTLQLDRATGDMSGQRARKIDDFMRPDDGVHPVGDIADVLEEVQEAATEIARFVDDEQRRGRGHHEFRDTCE